MEELKLQELERRLKQLESKFAKSRFNYFYANKKSEKNKTVHEFDFDLVVKANCYLKVEIAVNCAIAGFLTEIFVNGVKVFNKTIFENTFNFSRVLPFAGGENTVNVKVSSESEFEVLNCEFSTFGDVDYPKINSILAVINESDQSIILFVVNGRLAVKRYQTQLETILLMDGISSAGICKIGDNYLLTAIAQGGNCTNYLYDSNFNLIQNQPLDQNLSSVCSLNGLEFATVFAVKGNCVYRYQIDANLNVVVTKTEYRAKRVASNPALSKYIIITDHANNGKIIKI